MKATADTKKLPLRKIHYYRQRQKQAVFQKVAAYFSQLAETKGLTQKQLAKLIGRDTAVVNRLMAGPGNWTLDTLSDLLLAMNSEMSYEIVSLNAGIQAQISQESESAPFDIIRLSPALRTMSSSESRHEAH